MKIHTLEAICFLIRNHSHLQSQLRSHITSLHGALWSKLVEFDLGTTHSHLEILFKLAFSAKHTVILDCS
jgi:hypothetical protein